MSEACVGVKIFPMLSSTRYDLRASDDPKRNALRGRRGGRTRRAPNVAWWYYYDVRSHGGMPFHARCDPLSETSLCFKHRYE